MSRGHNKDEFNRLRFPGLEDVPIQEEISEAGGGFSYGLDEWEERRITAREKAIIEAIDRITDIPGWHKLCFDEEVALRWETTARTANSLVSEKTWKWILEETRDKAKTYEDKRHTLTLNIGSGVCKADELVPADIAERLQHQTSILLEQFTEKELSRHINSNQQVDLVDPSLYPLVYERSKVLLSEAIPLENCSEFSGKGKVLKSTWTEGFRYEFKWSRHFQLLPCEVEFVEPHSTKVRIASYINNLHPARYKESYALIERLITVAIEPLNEVLVRSGYKNGRTPHRILTYGASYIPERPPDHLDSPIEYNLDLESNSKSEHPEKRSCPQFESHKESRRVVEEYLALEDDGPQDNSQRQLGPQEQWIANYGLHNSVKYKYYFLRRLVHPEPGISFTFQDWKEGKTRKAVVAPSEVDPNRRDPYFHEESPDKHEYYTVNLQNTFRKQGLQFTVRISSIELTSDHPTFVNGHWNAGGMANDHVAATVLYFYDVNNVKSGRIAFRQEASLEAYELSFGPDGHEPDEAGIASTFAFATGAAETEKRVQTLGSVKWQQGRLLAFPSTLHYRMKPFELDDKTKAGHCRFVTLHLVDPLYKLCSTRNVPPQQADWWAENGFDKIIATTSSHALLSQELVDEIAAKLGHWPIKNHEASRLRDEYNREYAEMMGEFETYFGRYDFDDPRY